MDLTISFETVQLVDILLYKMKINKKFKGTSYIYSLKRGDILIPLMTTIAMTAKVLINHHIIAMSVIIQVMMRNIMIWWLIYNFTSFIYQYVEKQ